MGGGRVTQPLARVINSLGVKVVQFCRKTVLKAGYVSNLSLFLHAKAAVANCLNFNQPRFR